ncbi:calmodulin [Scheffersomyces coipomensis]|uniref:calmodulin n=1 Tax=Scheffersomyces coipomensis TaxID=1788519 RepID=UPI00315CC23D
MVCENQSLSSEQINKYRDVFRLFDKNNDGTIDQNELKTVMRALNHDPTQTEIEELIDHVDINKDGKIDFREFILILAKHLKDTDEELELIEVFKIFDQDGDGKINSNELKYILFTIGEQLQDSQINEMIEEADLNKDGVIDIDEFRELLQSCQYKV